MRGPGSRPVARREPRLKLGRTGPRASVAAYRDGAGASKVRFGARRREGVLGGSLLGGASPGGSALRSPGLGGSRFASSSMGRSLLGGSVLNRSSPRGVSSALGRSSFRFGRSAPLGLSSPLGHRGNLMRSAGGGQARRAPRFSRGGSLARLTGALRGSAGPKSPGRGWLRGASSRRTSLGGNSLSGTSLGRNSLGRGAFGRRRMGRASRGLRVWIGAGAPRLKSARSGPARLRMPRPKVKRRWRTGGYR